MKNVFILGGTGLLGYHTTKLLLEEGYNISTIALPPMPAEDILPKQVECRLGNMNELSDEEILEMLEGMDVFIHAGGVDERVVPQAPATKYFYEENVLPTQRFARLARQAGIKKFVIYGSYFAYFAEKMPDLKLSTEQAYPRTRLLQEEVAIMEGEESMDVTVLRLPYIFGTMPGRKPLWEMFLPQIVGKDVVKVLGGGTAMVTVKQVAQATLGAIKYGKHGEKYAISDTNMKHKEFFERIAKIIGQENTIIEIAPFEEKLAEYKLADEYATKQGKEHGIHIAVTAYLQNRDLYVDPEETMPILKYEKDDVEQAIVETIKACIE